MNLLASIEFDCANIERAINQSNYDDNVVVTVRGEEAELAFSNGFVSFGRVIQNATKNTVNCIVSSNAFKANYTKYQIVIGTHTASITAVNMKKLH